MRSLKDFRQEARKSASYKPAPAVPISPPANPKEVELCLDVLGFSSNDGPPPSGPPRGGWRAQLERLKQFIVKILRLRNYRS